MNIQQLLEGLAERLSAGGSVKNVYGEPVSVGDRTIIPAARVRYAFGAGAGRRKPDAEAGGGGGGGGRVSAKPCGALEITPEGTRFIVFEDRRRIGIALGVGFILGATVAALSGTKRIEILKRRSET